MSSNHLLMLAAVMIGVFVVFVAPLPAEAGAKAAPAKSDYKGNAPDTCSGLAAVEPRGMESQTTTPGGLRAGDCLGGGCTNFDARFPPGTLSDPPTTFVIVDFCNFPGEYARFAVIQGETYEWTLCAADGGSSPTDSQLTLRNQGGANVCFSDDFCGAAPKIEWTATYTGFVDVLISEFPCQTTFNDCHTMLWRCSSCPPPPCTPDFTVTAPHRSPTRNTCGAGDDCTLQTIDEHIYEVTIPSGGVWTFSLCDASYDTYLFLGTNCCGAEIGSNDDFCLRQSEMTVDIPAGTYFVAVEGFPSAADPCGDYILDIFTDAPPPHPLANDTPETFAGIPKDFSFDISTDEWCAVGIYPTSDHDVQADDNVDFSSPYASSTETGATRDFVVANGHIWGDVTHFAQVFGGSPSDYTIEAEWDSVDLQVGTPHADDIAGGEVLAVYDVALNAGAPYVVSVDVTSRAADLALFVFEAGRSSGSRSSADWESDSAGPGGDESVAFTAPATGVYCIVVANEDNGTANYQISVGFDAFCGDGSCNGSETCETCETDCGPCPSSLVFSAPDDQESLWRTRNNFLRLTFDDDILAPGDNDVRIEVMVDGGLYGVVYSTSTNGPADFTVTVNTNGAGQPRVLEIRENGAVLTHRTWVAVRNTGDWAGVESFAVRLAVQFGDVNNNNVVLSNDAGAIFPKIPIFDADDDERADVNGDGMVLSNDAGAVFPHVPSFDNFRPSGHGL